MEWRLKHVSNIGTVLVVAVFSIWMGGCPAAGNSEKTDEAAADVPLPTITVKDVVRLPSRETIVPPSFARSANASGDIALAVDHGTKVLLWNNASKIFSTLLENRPEGSLFDGARDAWLSIENQTLTVRDYNNATLWTAKVDPGLRDTALSADGTSVTILGGDWRGKAWYQTISSSGTISKAVELPVGLEVFLVGPDRLAFANGRRLHLLDPTGVHEKIEIPIGGDRVDSVAMDWGAGVVAIAKAGGVIQGGIFGGDPATIECWKIVPTLRKLWSIQVPIDEASPETPDRDEVDAITIDRDGDLVVYRSRQTIGAASVRDGSKRVEAVVQDTFWKNRRLPEIGHGIFVTTGRDPQFATGRDGAIVIFSATAR